MTDKELAKEAYLEGYELGKGVEEIDETCMRMARVRFERWWSLNQE